MMTRIYAHTNHNSIESYHLVGSDFFHLSPPNFSLTEQNQQIFLTTQSLMEVLQWHTTGKHDAFKKGLKELLHALIKTM